jgi:hypothetical protein
MKPDNKAGCLAVINSLEQIVYSELLMADGDIDNYSSFFFCVLLRPSSPILTLTD